MNHVLVDYENVQEIDLPAGREIPISLVLFVGEKQNCLKTELVEQLLPRAAQVQLVRMTVSGIRQFLSVWSVCSVGSTPASNRRRATLHPRDPRHPRSTALTQAFDHGSRG